MQPSNRAPIALTIAGSDSGGGAGIQADLKTFSALGVYGCSVVTALTAQNTRGVTGIFGVHPGFVRAQMDAVFDDLRVDAVKIGMLGGTAIIEAVAEGLERWRPRWVVLDPVMVAKGGDRLLEPDAVTALRDRLVPLATIITPNLPEAGDLTGFGLVRGRDEMTEVALRLQGLGARAVLVKGGHLQSGESPDLLLTEDGVSWFDAPRIGTRNTHGTGCTLSSAVAAGLAKGLALTEAVREAKAYVAGAIAAADALDVGKGHGPVHHFHRIW